MRGPAAVITLSLVLALSGQRVITDRPLLGVVPLAAAVFLFYSSLASWSELTRRLARAGRLPALANRPAVRTFAFRLLSALAAALFAALAFLQNGHNQFTLAGALSWAGSIVFFLLAFAQRPEQLPRLRLQRHHLALLAILLLAGFFRFYRLSSIPSEMNSDHAEKLLDVHDVLEGARPVFFERNTGREAFQFYLTAGLIWTTPLEESYLALKVGTAIFGLVAVPFTYLLGAELFGRKAGLLAAFLLAVSHWHVAITRVGLRFPFTAAFATPALYFLFRALRGNRRNDWLACGFSLGLGLHTYSAMRIVPFLLAALVALKAGLDWLDARKTDESPEEGLLEASSDQLSFWLNGLLATAAATLLFMPLLRFMLDKPENFWLRSQSRLPGLAQILEPESWRVLAGNVWNALLMFNVRGDVVPANTIPGSPVLGWVTGALFLFGLATLVVLWLRARDRRCAYVLLSLALLLAPSILSLQFPEENPSVVRMGGAPPVISLIAALPLLVIWERLRSAYDRAGPALAGVILGALLVGAILYNYQWYFVRYDEHYRRSAWNSSEMGQVLREFLEEGGRPENAYHIPYPYWVDTRAIGINAGQVTWNNAVNDLDQLGDLAALPGRALYILHLEDRRAQSALRELHPDGQVRQFRSAVKDQGKDFLVFRTR